MLRSQQAFPWKPRPPVAVVAEIVELPVQREQLVALQARVLRLEQVMDAVAVMAEAEMVVAMEAEQARDKFPPVLLQLLLPVPRLEQVMAEAVMAAAMDVVATDAEVMLEPQALPLFQLLQLTMPEEMMPPDRWQATRAPVVVDSRQ